MAAPRSSLPMILAGTLLFGGLTFLLGLLIGVNLAVPVAKPSLPAGAAVPAPAASVPVPALPAAPSAPALPAPAPAAPVAAPAQGGASAGGGPAPSGAAPSTAAPAPAAPAKSSAAEPPPAVKPVKVKGFGYGTPPAVEPASALRGKLLTADTPATDAADAAKAAPKEAPKDAGPALVYSVSLGRFLMEENAGRLYAKAQEQGYQPVVVVPDPPDPSGWLTVTLGPQADATAAGRLALDASAQGFETWLVTWQAP